MKSSAACVDCPLPSKVRLLERALRTQRDEQARTLAIVTEVRELVIQHSRSMSAELTRLYDAIAKQPKQGPGRKE